MCIRDRLKNSVGWVTRTTKADTNHIALFFTFNGLKRIDKEGHSYSVSVELEVRYRRVGSSDWISYGGTRTTGGGNVPLVELRPRIAAGNFSIGINPDNSFSINGGMAIAVGEFVIEKVYYEAEHGNGGMQWYSRNVYYIRNLHTVNNLSLIHI